MEPCAKTGSDRLGHDEELVGRRGVVDGLIIWGLVVTLFQKAVVSIRYAFPVSEVPSGGAPTVSTRQIK